MRAPILVTMLLVTNVFATTVAAQAGTLAAPAGPTLAELRRQQEMARRVPVTIALVDELPAPDSIPVVILRRGNLSPHDVILVRGNSASADQLAAAVLHLLVMRDRSGDTASVNSAFRLPTARRGPRSWDHSERPRMERVLARLRRSLPNDVPGIGTVRATEIYLPSKKMRDAARSGGFRSVQR